MEALPRSVDWFLGELKRSGFRQTDEEHGPGFGDCVLTFERSPVEVRVISDKAQWAADIRVQGWGEDERVRFPIFEGALSESGS
jgi:hypothetical protein